MIEFHGRLPTRNLFAVEAVDTEDPQAIAEAGLAYQEQQRHAGVEVPIEIAVRRAIETPAPKRSSGPLNFVDASVVSDKPIDLDDPQALASAGLTYQEQQSKIGIFVTTAAAVRWVANRKAGRP